MDLKNETKTAVMIEPRRHKAIKFVLENFLECLDDSWNILILLGDINFQYVTKIVQDLNTSRIEIKNIKLPNLSLIHYSRMMMAPKIYEFIPTEIFMIFQTDSIININNKDALNDFLKYDYVGAPWSNMVVGNGGLSIRKKSKILEVIKNVPPRNSYEYEDIYFSAYAGFHKPSFEKAKEFSVETIFYLNPFGIHNCWKYLPKEKVDILNENIPGLKELQTLQYCE